MIDSNAQASVNTSQNLDALAVFSCYHCTVKPYGKEYCDDFQRQGRCRAALLGEALRVGSIQIILNLPVGRVSQ